MSARTWLVDVDGARVEVRVEPEELATWQGQMRHMGLRFQPAKEASRPSVADFADVVHAVRRAEQVGVLTAKQRDLLVDLLVAAHERRLLDMAV